MSDVASVMQSFKQVFGGSVTDAKVYRSPGRVNLIGDHTDYVGGTVLPMALNRGTWLVARPRSDRRIQGFSANFADEGTVQADLDDTSFNSEHGWFSYVLGVIHVFAQMGTPLTQGVDLYLEGDIPNGAGLSSSASVELAAAVMANDLGEYTYTPTELALIGQDAENNYVGVACGIMDQLSIAMGKRDHAIVMNCDTLECDYSPFPSDKVSLVVANTNKRRSLNESAYNERRATCEAAVAILRKHRKLDNLVDLTWAEYEQWADDLADDEMRARVRHVVTEQDRVLRAAEALRTGDLVQLGALMRQSHESLRDDYEVTGEHLDALAEAAWETDGVVGARMTGAGFGGCTVNLVEPDAVGRFIEEVGQKYQERMGLAAQFYVLSSDDGAREVTQEATD